MAIRLARTIRNFRIVATLSLCLTLGFCATWDQEPLHVVDPGAFGIPLTTIYSLGF